jgi:hypothetical protein
MSSATTLSTSGLARDEEERRWVDGRAHLTSALMPYIDKIWFGIHANCSIAAESPASLCIIEVSATPRTP